jgi:hypothetical protein
VIAMATASPSFIVVKFKICEKCGAPFLRSAESVVRYCGACVTFFVTLAALEAAAPPVDPAPVRRKTGPKPNSKRFRAR